MRTKSAAPRRTASELRSDEWIPRLHVASQTPKSLAAFANLQRVLVGMELQPAKST